MSSGVAAMQKSVIVETQKRYAVCIGINHYVDSQGMPALRYAEKDAQAVYELLLQRGFAPENCRLLLGSQATQQAIHNALKSVMLDNPRKEDLVLFYFAGHGVPISFEDDEEDDVLTDVFLTCFDFPLQEIRAIRGSWLDFPLRLERLRTQFFERTRSKKVLIILDSGHSGDFYGPKYRGGETVAHGHIDQAFGRMSAGRVVLSSCMPQQKAYEDEKRQHGRFTYYLLDALEGKQRNAVGRDGWMTVSSLFDYVAKTMHGEQCPVESGVKHGSFELLYYPAFDEKLAIATKPTSPEAKRAFHLRALFANHQRFLRDRLASFVGREKELAEIRALITLRQQTGGYLTITGQAGQGKSSIIAKLVEEYGPDNVAYHFIPFNPGPDHQVGLLRNLMARLILKYHLSEFYVTSESRGALRDYFPKVFDEVVAQGGREVIFVDGLDQLEVEATGIRDLSFLPNDLPPGIVFVLSVRPNETLHPLEVLKPRDEYRLPNLSRQDFDCILQHRRVSLEREQADQFYEAVQQNALYLDLVAKELLEADNHLPADIIARLTSNPDNLFSLTMTRLKRYPLEWREVLKPLLGVLLVAQAPLSRQSLRQILDVDADQLNEGLAKLGGLLVEDEQQRYSLFHLKLQEYLGEDKMRPHKEYIFATDDVEGWHSTLASWCELKDLSLIWRNTLYNEAEQDRRLYARYYYLTHLYEARQWERLFEELDAGQYGQSKLHFDPGMRLYTQDLNYGCKAAAWEGWTLEEGMALLPCLWRYTLLRCSLQSRANAYPPTAFKFLVVMGQEQKALALTELITTSDEKAKALLAIAQQMSVQPGQERERILQVLLGAYDAAKAIAWPAWRAEVLREVAEAFMDMQQWGQAREVIDEITVHWQRARALGEMGRALAQAGDGERAEAIWAKAEEAIGAIEWMHEKIEALSAMGLAFARGGQERRAEAMWAEAERLTETIVESDVKSIALSKLGRALAQSGRWEKGKALIHTIEGSEARLVALSELGMLLARAGRWEETESLIQTLTAEES
jgi:hypothetical protein